MTGAVLAIDFGTTSCAAVLVDGVRRTQLREPASGLWTWPSAVFIDGNLPLVGSAAVNLRRLAPNGYREELKRYLGQDLPVVLSGGQYRVATLISLLLQAIRVEAERVHGAPVRQAVITVPAAYGPADLRTSELIKAAGAAGLIATQVLAEPVAAALAPIAGEPLPPGSTVLVYDFGGGTFDAALVRLAAGDTPPAVLGAAALDDCGGRDLDAAIIDQLRRAAGPVLIRVLDRDSQAKEAEAAAADQAADEVAPEVTGRDAEAGANRVVDDVARLGVIRDRMEFAEFARQLKHRAGAETAPADYFRPAGLVLRLDQQRLRALAQPLIDRTVRCCQDLLGATAPRAVDALVLVGGSSRLPGLAEQLARTLRLPLRCAEDPEVAVSQGAAVWAVGGPVRTVVARSPRPDREPLSWILPPGPARLVEWHVALGTRYQAGQVLGRISAASGKLIDLVAARPGLVRSQHVQPGGTVLSGDWLLTVDHSSPS